MAPLIFIDHCVPSTLCMSLVECEYKARVFGRIHQFYNQQTPARYHSLRLAATNRPTRNISHTCRDSYVCMHIIMYACMHAYTLTATNAAHALTCASTQTPPCPSQAHLQLHCQPRAIEAAAPRVAHQLCPPSHCNRLIAPRLDVGCSQAEAENVRRLHADDTTQKKAFDNSRTLSPRW